MRKSRLIDFYREQLADAGMRMLVGGPDVCPKTS
jgi:hypothetical protein